MPQMVAAETIKALRAVSPGGDASGRQAGVSRLSNAATTAGDAAAAAGAVGDAGAGDKLQLQARAQ